MCEPAIVVSVWKTERRVTDKDVNMKTLDDSMAAGVALSNGQSEGHLSHAQKRRSPHTSPRGMLAGADMGQGQGQAQAEPHDMPMPHWAPAGMSHAGSAPQVRPCPPQPYHVHIVLFVLASVCGLS